MKKLVTLLGILLVASLFSCKDVEEIESQKLGVSKKDTYNNIAVPYMADVSYINIFRQRVGTDGEVIKTENIGQIIPAAANRNSSYNFEDSLITAGESYQYLARYFIKGSYVSSGWSDVIVAMGGATGEYAPELEPADVYFEMDSVGYISINGPDGSSPAITISKPKYYLTIAVSNKKEASTFRISEATADSDHPAKIVNPGFSKSLTSIMNTSYYNRSLSFLGVVGERVVYYDAENGETDSVSEKTEYKIVYWTGLQPVKLYEFGTFGSKEDITKNFLIFLNETTEDDFDFTGLRAALGSTEAVIDYSGF